MTVTAILALTAALIVGGSDFIGGVGARRSPVLRVTLWIQGASLALTLAAALVIDASLVAPRDVIAGVVAGGSGIFSFLALYSAFARGQISLLAPITAVVSATIPAGVGFARGEDIGAWNVSGMALALVAIALVSQTTTDGTGPKTTPWSAVALAVVAGLGFASFFLALSETSTDAGLWPLVVARLVSVPPILLLSLAVTGGVAVAGFRGLLLAAGAAEAVHNILLLFAFQRGPIAIAAVMGAMYPMSTVLLARLVLHERLERVQVFGVVLALVAVPIVAVPGA